MTKLSIFSDGGARGNPGPAAIGYVIFDQHSKIIKKGGADQSKVKEKINELEDEINDLVYQIYGITKEERKIVEANL